MDERKKRIFRVVFPIAVVLLAVGGVLFGVSDTARRLLGYQVYKFPGSRTSFDPIAAYPKVAKLAGAGARLKKIEARYVRSDGTMNLDSSDYESSVRYTFTRKYSGDEKSAPPGTGGPRGDYEIVEVVIIKPRTYTKSRGGGCSSRSTKEQLTPYMWRRAFRSPEKGPDVAPPQCTFSQLWKKAAGKGMPRNGVAIIEYTRHGYRFSMQGQSQKIHFDPQCQLDEKSS